MEQITKWIICSSLFLSLIPGCAVENNYSGTDNTSNEQAVSSQVEIKPSRVELAKGGSLNLVLYLHSDSGDELRPDLKKDSLDWVSNNPDIVEVDKYGTVSGVGIGQTTVMLKAVIDGKDYSGSIPVKVRSADIREITLNPYLIMLAKNDEKILDLYASDFQGNPKSLEPEHLLFEVSNTDVLRVVKQANGQPKLISKSRSGHAFVTVTYLGLSGQPVKVNVADNVLVEPNSKSDLGRYSSIFVTSDNHVHVAYYNATTGALKYAYWDEKAWRNETVIQSAYLNAGQDAKIVVAGNVPYISYYEANSGNLKIVGRVRGVWAESPMVETSGLTGPKSGFVIKDGLPTIIYEYRESSGASTSIRFAQFSEGEWGSTTVTTSHTFETGIDLKISRGKIGVAFLDGDGYVTFLESTDNGETWNSAEGLSTRVEKKSSASGSVALNYSSLGQPHLAYYVPGGGVQFAKPSQTAFGKSWGFAVLDSSTSFGGEYLDAVIDYASRDRISFYDAVSGDLKLVKFNQQRQSFDQAFTADGGGKYNDRVGEYSSVGINSYGQTVICYYNLTKGRLQFYIEPYNPN
jgi:hypothetical protein